ncbi:MAG: glucosyltransferase protein [Hyphomicrobiales bacterium]|nr:glucosyltransferase protein [Hyphomicrobiales bacterium]
MTETIRARAADPTVDVIIAAKDAAGTITRAITSALQQSHVRRVFVIDDGSGDDTLAVARAAAEGSAKLEAIRLPENRGPSAARNIALSKSTADLICVLDADDFMMPERLSKMVRQVDGSDLLADDLFFCTLGNAKIRTRNLLGLNDGDTGAVDLETFVRSNVTKFNEPRREMGFLKPLVSRRFLVEHDLCYREDMRLGEDYALYAEALLLGARFKTMTACGYVSVERDDSLSARHTIADLRALRDFDADLLRRQLQPGERSAIAEHMFNTACRLEHRRLLQAKKEGRYRDALGILFQAPRTAAYIVRTIAREKTGL